MRTPNSHPKKKLRKSPSPSSIQGNSLLFDTSVFGQSFSTEEDIPLEVKNITKCNCKNSRCLKLYCDCFANSATCSSNCSCQNCHNVEGNEQQIEFAKSIILRRNPIAFEKKIMHGTMHSRGCKCKKTRCLKKYCECYQANVQCTQYCECISCANGKDGLYDTSNSLLSALT